MKVDRLDNYMYTYGYSNCMLSIGDGYELI